MLGYQLILLWWLTLLPPIITLLKKDGFVWTDQATHVFQALKRAMTTTPLLDLYVFSIYFFLGCDAFGIGIEAVLMQKGRPIAFIRNALSSKALAFRHMKRKWWQLSMPSPNGGHTCLGGDFRYIDWSQKPQVLSGASGFDIRPTKVGPNYWNMNMNMKSLIYREREMWYRTYYQGN